MNQKLLLVAMMLSFGATTQAQAVSKRVSSPNVSKGLAVDTRGSFTTDDEDVDEFRNNFQIKYGVTDRFRISADTDYRKKAGQDAEFNNSDIEIKYVLHKTDNVGVSFGTGYEFNHSGDSNAIGASLNGQYKLGKWKHQGNLGFEREVGDEAERGLDFAFRSGHYYKLETVEVGVEYFADFGNLRDDNDFEEQEHHIGPVVNFKVPVGEKNIKAVLGYAAGLTDASDDHVFKYDFGYKF